MNIRDALEDAQRAKERAWIFHQLFLFIEDEYNSGKTLACVNGRMRPFDRDVVEDVRAELLKRWLGEAKRAGELLDQPVEHALQHSEQ